MKGLRQSFTGKKNAHNFSYKLRFAFEKRQQESATIMSKYPDRIPIVCERSAFEKSTDVPFLDKNKFLVPSDLSVGQFLYTIRRRVHLSPDKALFLFLGNKYKLVPTSETILSVYEKNKDDDGFLYVVYSGESTFGN
jgi:GABA(A) receptor-associated protein